MKIAQIAPCWLPVPPPAYGGIEQVVAVLTDELVARGHEVSLFASGDSCTTATLRSYVREAPGIARFTEDAFFDLPHVLNAFAAVDEFDLVHDHTFPFGPAVAACVTLAPIVHTVHLPLTWPLAQEVYGLVDESVHLVAVSADQQRSVPQIRVADVVHNGIDIARFPFRVEKEEFLAFVGRPWPGKGLHIAIEAARRAGLPLVVACKRVETAVEREYFDGMIAPLLGEDIDYREDVPFEEKADLVARARGLLMPICWDEPFGLVMVEAMACGTPVVAFDRGAAVELVDHGITGFVVDDINTMVAALDRLDEIDPFACRRRVANNFSTHTMVDGYEALYRRLLAQ